MAGSARERLVGAWRLVASEARRADGQAINVLEENPEGALIYSADGYVSAQLMRRDRPAFRTADKFRASPEKVKTAFDGYVCYFGPFEVDEGAGTVTHHVRGCLRPKKWERNGCGVSSSRGTGWS